MKICVVGTGYVGLVAGTCFAESGNDVVCVDNVAAKIEALRQGHVPIYEPGLEELIRRNVSEARLAFSTDLADAVKKSPVCFIAVGTPEGADGAADLSAVMDVAAAIGRAMDGYRVIVAKSTVPIGTAERIKQAVAAATRSRTCASGWGPTSTRCGGASATTGGSAITSSSPASATAARASRRT